MNFMTFQRIGYLGYYSILVYLLVLLMAFHMQQSLIYLNWVKSPFSNLNNPSRSSRLGFREKSVQSLNIYTFDNITLHGWLIFPTTKMKIPLQDAKKVLIYFHGNAGDIASFSRTSFYKRLAREGCHVFMFDYRGFGLSDQTKTPTEAGLQVDAVSIFNYVSVILGVPSRKIVLVGHSLGTGVATFLARNLTISQTLFGGLVLLCGYTSIPEAAFDYPIIPLLYPLKNTPVKHWLINHMSEQWNSQFLFLAGIYCPVFLIHGSEDYEIPISHSRRLFLSAVQGNLKSRKGSHKGVSQITNFNRNLELEVPSDVYPKKNVTLEHFSMAPIENEGVLWMSKDLSIWLLDIRHGGHNSLQSFDLLFDVLHDWFDQHF